MGGGKGRLEKKVGKEETLDYPSGAQLILRLLGVKGPLRDFFASQKNPSARSLRDRP